MFFSKINFNMGRILNFRQLSGFLQLFCKQGKKKVLLTIYSSTHIGMLKKVLNRLSKLNAELVLICLNTLIIPELERQNITFKHIEDYSSVLDLYPLNEEAWRLANNWYLENNNAPSADFTNFSGISLGSLIQWEMNYYFAHIFLCIEQIKATRNKEKPDIIIMFENRPKKINSIIVQKDEFLYFNIARNLFSYDKLVCIYPSFLNKVSSSILHLFSANKNFSISIKSSKFTLSLPELFVRNIKSLNSYFNLKLYSFINFFKKTYWRNKRDVKETNNISIPPPFANSSLEKELLREGKNKVFILDGTPSIRDFDRKNVVYRELNNYRVPVNFKSGEFTNNIFNKFMGLTATKKLSYRGISLWDMVEERFIYIFKKRFLKLISDIYALDNFLSKEEINYIVSYGNTTEIQKALLLLGKRMRIPSLFVQPGNIGHAVSCLPVYADEIAVYGEIYAEWFKDNGIPEEKIFISGPFNFNHTLKEEAIKKEDFFKELRLDPQKKLFVLALERYLKKAHFPGIHLFLKSQIEYILKIIGMVERFPQCQLAVKFHPGDDNFEFITKYILKKYEKLTNVVFSIRADQNKLLYFADLLITRISTIALKAMALDKKIIVLNFERIPRFIPLEDSGLVGVAYKEEDLSRLIKQVIESKIRSKFTFQERRKIVNRYVYVDGEDPSKVIVRHIQERLNKNGSKKIFGMGL